MKQKGFIAILLFIIAFISIFILTNIWVKQKVCVRTDNSLIILSSYSSLKEALDSNNYQNYPSNLCDTPKGIQSNIYQNPVTKQKLVLDKSEGGGYRCCEMSSFNAYIDKQDGLLWIRDYQASIDHIYSKWYGPFKLNKP